jgi:uncharacterized protein YacL
MTSPLTINLLRALYVVFVVSIGAMIGSRLEQLTAGIIISGVVGLFVVLLDALLRGITLRVFSSATFGLLLGFLAAELVKASEVLIWLSEDIQWAASLSLYTVLGYLGMMLALRSNREDFSLIIPYVRFTRHSLQDQPILLDSNVIIDGRVIELCEIEFLSSQVIVPRFIVDELHQLADSHDTYKRERGRRGLDNLEKMQKNRQIHVSMHESNRETEAPVDVRLLHLAKMVGARLITNDNDLTKSAYLQQVQVLNLNDLNAAMRPTVSPGDQLRLQLTKAGRDDHQAVGYSDDGTMIVVNNAREHIGDTVDVIVAGTTQTNAGRLVFAELENNGANSPNES